MSTDNSTALHDLYLTIHNVYAPNLRGGHGLLVDSRLSTLMKDLEETLYKQILINGTKNTLAPNKEGQQTDDDEISGIFSLKDEENFWREKASSVPSSSSVRCLNFVGPLSRLCVLFSSSSSSAVVCRVDDFSRVIDDAADRLNELWMDDGGGGAQYSQRRMQHLLNLISQCVVSFVSHTLSSRSSLSLWSSPLTSVKELISSCLLIIDQWQLTMRDLTEHDWANRWTTNDNDNDGDSHSDSERGALSAMATRCRDILRCRCLVAEAQRLFGNRTDFSLSDMFRPFIELGPDACIDAASLASPSRFQNALTTFDTQFSSVCDEHAASLLHQRFAALSSRPLLLATEFRLFSALTKRARIAREIDGQVREMVAQIGAMVEELKTGFDNQCKVYANAERGSNERVNGCVWVATLVAKARHLSSVLRLLSGDGGVVAASDLSSSVSRVDGALKEVRSRIEVYGRELFQDWQEALLDDVLKRSNNGAGGEAAAALSGQGIEIEFDTTGALIIRENEHLATLLHSVRTMSEHGYAIDDRVSTRILRDGSRIARVTARLHQVSAFYATTRTEMVPSQVALLTGEAHAFEQVVREFRSIQQQQQQMGVFKIDEYEKYVQRLLEAAERLSIRNRKLRSLQVSLSSLVINIMNTDMLRARDAFIDAIKRLSTLVSREDKGSSGFALRVWKSHWEAQLYKAVNINYRLCLETLNDNLTEMNVDIVFARKVLAFRPPLEDLRTSYYRHLKKFIDFPRTLSLSGTSSALSSSISSSSSSSSSASLNSSGIGDVSSLFSSIPERHGDALFSVFSVAESIFVQIRGLLTEYAPWMVLGTIDIDEYIESHLEKVYEWEANFEMLARKRQEASLLPDTRRIGSFIVSLLPLKNQLSDQLHRFSDGLIVSLKKSVTSSMKAVDDYLSDAMNRLKTRPHTVAEMAAAKTKWDEIAKQKTTMAARMTDMLSKDTLLRTVASITLDLSSLRARWDDFNVYFDAFQDMLGEQKDALKVDISKKVSDLRVAIDKFHDLWSEQRASYNSEKGLTRAKAESTIHSIKDRQEEVQGLRSQADELMDSAEQFDMRVPEFDVLNQVEDEINNFQTSWSLYSEYTGALEPMVKESWIAFRAHILSFDEFIAAWIKKLKGRAPDAVSDYVKRDLAINRDLFPILRKVQGESFEREHWRTLFTMLKFPSTLTVETLTLGHFIEAHAIVLANQKAISDLAARALGEVRIREDMAGLRTWSEVTMFALTEYVSTAGPIQLIKDWKELFTLVSDQQSLVASLKESPYFGPFEDVAKEFERKLTLVDESLHTMNSIQRKWVYLEPIFGRGALPSEQGRFKRIDEEFRDIWNEIALNSQVVALANVPNIKDRVIGMLDQLERCQKALNDFLEQKRSAFPRFYFIGDDDLLEVLGQAMNPAVIENHLKKLFGGIHSVNFKPYEEGGKPSVIAEMKSSDGEVVPLIEPGVTISENVEVWLQQLADVMVATLRQCTIDCYQAAEPVDVNKFPSQILCLTAMIKFTGKVEACIKRSSDGSALRALHDELTRSLATYTSMDTSDNRLMQLKVKALVMDLIHNRDVVQQLLDAKVASLDHWVWQKQLRFYLDDKQQAIVRMVDAQFQYTYEYQGNVEKLVHTPLSDKCYLVLTQGMHLGYGGCPFGPAGTGKTESVKALATAMGRQVLVFNCDEGIDFQAMGRIFTGLVKSGAWGCFDEFNRLREDQLSAVSTQIQVIQAALKKRDPVCELLGREVNVDQNAAIFVTMNPASKEYGGRSKLPHNLKQLFRDVAMAAPDIGLITQVILLSEGYVYASDIAVKVVEVFELSRQLLSKQRHYDWGLRALKTVLRHAGQLIQAEKKKVGAGGQVDHQTEKVLMIGALKINTLSKLTFADSVRFIALLGDVFPGVVATEIDYKQLEAAIHTVLSECKLEVVPSQITKIIQLYEATQQRMGVVVVGPSGCGKSIMLRVLRLSLAKLGVEIVVHTMNPKAVERTKLLGYMDHDTREWTDGILTASARQVMREGVDTKSWVICDGDIDPEWVESLNSVLDDNHLLTMPNGERIKFNNNVNFVFETHDLQFASPATVSRMGMIFLSEEDIDIKSLLRAWLRTQDTASSPSLSSWMDAHFINALQWVLDSNSLVVATTKVGVVNTALSHLSAAGTMTTPAEFATALVRGMASNLPMEKRLAFAKQVFAWLGAKPVDGRPLDNVFRSGSVSAYVHEDTKFGSESLSIRDPPTVNTVDIQRNRDVIMPWLMNARPFILVGPEGCGKTLLLESCFKTLKSTYVATVHCSAQTSAQHVIQKLQEACVQFSTNKGPVYKPREGKERVVLFLKDLNLPKPDRYDTIQLIAFLQQLITYQGFYDDKLEWIAIERVQIVATMNPATTVGRHVLSTRFTAIVNVFYISYPDREALLNIYTSFMKATLSSVPRLADDNTNNIPGAMWKDKDGQSVRKLTASLVEVYEKLRAKFNVDDYRHYLFTPRDLTSWVFSLLRYDLSSQSLLDVVAYEAHRMFADRLATAEATKYFDQLLASVLKNQWKYEGPNAAANGNNSVKIRSFYYTSLNAFGAVMAKAAGGAGTGAAASTDTNVTANATGAVTTANNAPKPGGEGGDGEAGELSVLSEVGVQLERCSASEFSELVSEGVSAYEREFKELKLVLFPEVLDHISSVDRVLSKPGGSLLLVGDSGVGRRSAVTVVAHMLRISVWTPLITRAYSLKAFRADVKELLRKCGVEGARTVLLMEDAQVVDASMLEDVNSLLSAAEVPGLYTPQELEPMLAPLKELYASSGFQSRNLYDFFVSRVRANLHVVLSFDHRHPLFSLRCESNPAVYTRCTILWLGRWSTMGQLSVSQSRLETLLSSTKMMTSGATLDANALSSAIANIHASCVQRGATPLKFVTFLDTYLRVYQSKRAFQNESHSRLSSGLSKLGDAFYLVDNLSKEVEAKKNAALKKQGEADRALEQITERMQQASDRKKEVEQLQRTLGGEEEKLNRRRVEIENELKDIQPVLVAAKDAVGGIKKDNMNEIRAFRMPPPAIRNVIEGVLTLMKQEDLSWENMRKFLASPSVKEDILNFDVNAVDKTARDKVNNLIKKNADSFEDKKIRHVNVAAAPLAAWVKAVVKYSTVLDGIKPLQDEFQEANRKLDQARSRLKKCEQELTDLDNEVKELKAKFARLTGEAESLKLALDKILANVTAASNLLSKLSGEKKRWDEQVKSLAAGLDSLVYSALLAAAFITYLGGQPEDVRGRCLAEWKSMTKQPNFDFMTFMSTESEFLKWKAEGLPSDALSMQNGLVLVNSMQVPFIIDPNGQATTWLRTTLSSSGTSSDKERTCESVMMQDARFVNTVELAVRFGKTLIIQEVDGVPAFLYPLLRRDLMRQGPRWVVTIGDKQIDYHDSFRLFLVTRDAAPDLPSDATALINEVNFTVTRSGLEGQLLGLTLNQEKPELEAQKSELLAAEDGYKMKLAELEKQLLAELAASEGNILENTKLIESLNQTKTQSTEIQSALTKSKEVQTSLDQQRDVYRSIAKAGSILFFLVSQLKSVNNMYEFSLPSFLRLFQNNLTSKSSSNAGPADNRRIGMLAKSLILSLFHDVTRSLFKADRLMFGVHLLHSLYPRHFADKEWEFLTGDVAAAVAPTQAGASATATQAAPSSSPSQLPAWAPRESAAQYARFASTFPALVARLRFSDDAVWGKWIKQPRCEVDFPIPVTPAGANNNNANNGAPPAPGLSVFQRLLVVSVFRPDRLMSALSQYVCESLNVPSVSPPPLNLGHLIETCPQTEPVLFVCEGGADPTQELEDVAEKLGIRAKLFQVALGSGQTVIAMQQLTTCAQQGGWLLLKNLHLVIDWLPSLEKALKSISPQPGFRLWLTTEPHTSFPPILLQQSCKISYEAPPGIKQNLLRTYETWDGAYIANGSPQRAQVLFVLAWFHAIVQERRTYVPQGWTKYYEFSNADLRSGADIIDSIYKQLTLVGKADDPAMIPWSTIWGLFKFAIYGGRVDNDHDVRILFTYLRKFFFRDIIGTSKAPATRKLTQVVELPVSNNIDDYRALVTRLPDIDVPAFFNLAENIDASVQQSQSSYVVSQLRKLAASASLSVKFDRDAWRVSLTPILQLWDRLKSAGPQLLSKSPKLKKREQDYAPIDSFVVLENDLIHSLVTLIDGALSSLNSVVFSSGLLTVDVRGDALALMSGSVPWRWYRNWYGPTEPIQWMTGVVQRRTALLQWLTKTDNNTLLQQPLSLSELFTPRTFLNAVRQQTARVTKKPIDSLRLAATWDESLLPPSTQSLRVRVTGLLIQGCGFQGNILSALPVDAASISSMPPVTLAYIGVDDKDPYPEPNASLPVPMYFSPAREDFITEIKVPTKGQSGDRWILTGVAILLADFK